MKTEVSIRPLPDPIAKDCLHSHAFVLFPRTHVRDDSMLARPPGEFVVGGFGPRSGSSLRCKFHLRFNRFALPSCARNLVIYACRPLLTRIATVGFRANTI